MQNEPQITTDDEQSADLAASVAESREDARRQETIDSLRYFSVAAIIAAGEAPSKKIHNMLMKRGYLLQDAAVALEQTFDAALASGG